MKEGKEIEKPCSEGWNSEIVLFEKANLFFQMLFSLFHPQRSLLVNFVFPSQTSLNCAPWIIIATHRGEEALRRSRFALENFHFVAVVNVATHIIMSKACWPSRRMKKAFCVFEPRICLHQTSDSGFLPWLGIEIRFLPFSLLPFHPLSRYYLFTEKTTQMKKEGRREGRDNSILDES